MSVSAAGIATAVGVAGLGLAGAQAAGAFTPGGPAPISQQQLKVNQAMIASTPSTFINDQNYNPKYAALNSTIAWQNLFGTPGGTTSQIANTAGYYDAQGQFLGGMNAFKNSAPPAGASFYAKGAPLTVQTAAAPGSLATMAAAQPSLLNLQTVGRAGDIADVSRLGPAAYAAIAGYDPSATALLNGANQQVQTRLDSNGKLDPFTAQALQQNYRGGEAARGLAGGTADAAMEAYYQTATQEQRQVQNIGLANQQVGVNQGYYGDPFQQILSRTSGGVQPGTPSYTANQPNTTNISGGAYALAGQNYGQQYQSQNAGYASQMGALNNLLSPATARTIGGIASYFGSGSGVPAANNAGAAAEFTGAGAPGMTGSYF